MPAQRRPGYESAALERAREAWADLYTGENVAVSLFWVARANITGPVTLSPGRQPATRYRYPHAFAHGQWVLEQCQKLVLQYPDMLHKPLSVHRGASDEQRVLLEGQVEGFSIAIGRNHFDAFVADGDRLIAVVWQERVVQVLVVREGTVMAVVMGAVPDHVSHTVLERLGPSNPGGLDPFHEPPGP